MKTDSLQVKDFSSKLESILMTKIKFEKTQLKIE